MVKREILHALHAWVYYIYIYNIIRTLYVCFHPVYAQACHPIEVLSWPSLHPAAGRAPSLSQQSGHKLLHPLPGCHNSKPYWEMLTYYLVLTSLTPNRRITPLQAPWSKAAVEKTCSTNKHCLISRLYASNVSSFWYSIPQLMDFPDHPRRTCFVPLLRPVYELKCQLGSQIQSPNFAILAQNRCFLWCFWDILITKKMINLEAKKRRNFYVIFAQIWT